MTPEEPIASTSWRERRQSAKPIGRPIGKSLRQHQPVPPAYREEHERRLLAEQERVAREMAAIERSHAVGKAILAHAAQAETASPCPRPGN